MLGINQFVIILLSSILIFGCSKPGEPVKTNSSVKKLENVKGAAKLEVKQEIPVDFKGVMLGQSMSEVEVKFKGMYKFGNGLGCSDVKNRPCSKVSNLTIMNRPLTQAGFLFDKNKKLYLVALNYDEKYYEEVRDALIIKYGKPNHTESHSLTNKITGNISVFEFMNWTYKSNILSITNRIQDGSEYIPQGFLSITLDSKSTPKDDPADI